MAERSAVGVIHWHSRIGGSHLARLWASHGWRSNGDVPGFLSLR